MKDVEKAFAGAEQRISQRRSRDLRQFQLYGIVKEAASVLPAWKLRDACTGSSSWEKLVCRILDEDPLTEDDRYWLASLLAGQMAQERPGPRKKSTARHRNPFYRDLISDARHWKDEIRRHSKERADVAAGLAAEEAALDLRANGNSEETIMRDMGSRRF